MDGWKTRKFLVYVGAETSVCCAADRCGGRCGGAPQAGVQNACGHMYLDQGEEMNLERNLNNYLTMASQVVRQVRCALALVDDPLTELRQDGIVVLVSKHLLLCRGLCL